jgi:hypothetical protein
MDLLISNMRGHEERGWRYLRGVSGVRACEEGSRIELRNINNLSELDINSACEVSLGDNEREEGRRLRHF